ncbi:MAG: hypothetical protein E3J78_06940 [Candidatus Cloacimonadota bacterium]|nr:MAG: hypothetical protein E3J78_06940 [Candidatus Cloacimonadota bacterium]
MNRKQFFKRSLVGSLVALVFPSLLLAKKNPGVIETQRELCSTPKNRLLAQYPLTPDECWPPPESVPEWIKFTLTNAHSPIHMQVRAIDHATGKDDWIFGGSGMMVVEKLELSFSVLTKKLRLYQTVVLSYKYENDDVPVNIYIPVRRLFNDGEFRWNAFQATKNSEGGYSLMTFGRPGYVVEHWEDRIDIHLSS